nr:TonB-dependent receptor [Rufibacter ruber]
MKAYYTVADLSDPKLELKTEYGGGTASKTTSDFMAAQREPAYVGINGGFFAGNTSLSLVVQEGSVLAPNVKSFNRDYNGASTPYFTTRGAFGVFPNNDLDVTWVYNVGSANTTYSYPAPSPNALGSAPQPQPTADFPAGGQVWNPKIAIGGAPVLVQNGVKNITDAAEMIVVDNTSRRARTAIGYTATKKMIMLVVEGGNPEVSAGVTLSELADIMVSLGAVEALNLDGGGSSTMVVKGQLTIQPSDGTERAMPTSLILKQRAPEPIIYDTEMTSVFQARNGWTETGNAGYYGPSKAKIVPTGIGNRIASYTFKDLEPGRYEVYAWWVASTNRAKDTPYTIYREGVAQPVVKVDQTINGSAFNLVGTYDLKPNDSLVVTNLATAGTATTYVTIDAIKLQKVGGVTGSKKALAEIERTVQAYPVPTDGVLYLSYPDVIAKKSTLRVISMVGKVVLQTRTLASNSVRLDLSAVPAGVYISRLTVEGPIQKDKSSFIVSGRRTYVDVFTRMINKAQEDDPDWSPIPDYYFYDFNAKATFELGPDDRLFFSGYYGRDFFNFADENFNFNFFWGNRVASARWAHQFNPKFFVNTTFSASNYEYEIANKLDIFSFSLTSNITDLTLQTDFEYVPNETHHLRFGASGTDHSFVVGRLEAGSEDGSVDVQAGNSYSGQEFGLYASHDWSFTPTFTLSYGLRLSGFRNEKTFMGLEPRVSANYRFNETLSLKASYTRMFQYVHLVSNSGASLPTDIWYPSSPGVKPQVSDQVAIGLTKLYKDKYLFSTEAYYKTMKRQLDLRDGAQIFGNPVLEEEFVFGKGESYGQEFYVEKKDGKTTGWIGYTLSWTNRTFPDINNGKTFPTRFDRRHDLSVVVIHELSKRLSTTATFVYGTGNAYSLPVQRFIFQDVPGEDYTVIPVYTERNSFRLAAYHRLDLGLVYKLRPKRGASDLTFSVYNAYNRRNPYFVYFETLKDEETEQITGFVAKQVSLFPVIPSVTYNFKF